MRRAYSYIRFSCIRQLWGRSTRRQLEATKAYCEQNRLTLDDSFSLRDLGVSAFRSRNVKQGALRSFLDAVRLGKVPQGSVLIVESLDRLSRDQVKIALALFIEILDSGTTIVTLMPPREYTDESTSDLAGLLEPLVIMSRAYEESKTKSQRSKDNWQAKRNNLAVTKATAVCPSWLRLEKGQFITIQPAAEVVRTIFQWAREGCGIGSVCKRLNTNGVPGIGRQRKFWHHSFVAKILHNRAVLGEHQPHVWVDGKRKPTGEVLPDYYPAIVSESDFYAAQDGMIGRKIQRGPKGNNVANLFTGLLRDARDGCSMRIDNKGQRGGGQKIVSEGAKRGQKGSLYRSFPYAVLEWGFLDSVRGLKVSDLFPSTEKSADTEIAALSGKIRELEHKKEVIQRKIVDNPESEALADTLLLLEKTQRQHIENREVLKRNQATSKAETLGEMQALLALIRSATGEELFTLRTKVKGMIRSLVSEMRLFVGEVPAKRKGGRGIMRFAELQVFYSSGEAQTIFLIDDAKIPFKADYHPLRSDRDLRNYSGWWDEPTALAHPQESWWSWGGLSWNQL